jgi:small subunit ribosomal protein S5
MAREWIPKTELGKRVASGEITSIDSILEGGKKILEPEIVDLLLPDLREEVLQVTATQRMSASGRKQLMRAAVVLGNGAGYVGVGVGKSVEARDAIAEAVKEAKKNIMKAMLGCGSWECGCGTPHSILMQVSGKNGSTKIVLKPAPRGVGIVANEVAKKVLELAGVKDVWTFTKGRTRNILNMTLATVYALNSLNRLKKGVAEEKINGA